MRQILSWSVACCIILAVLPLKAQEIHKFRDHILYYGAPKGKIKSICLQEIGGQMILSENGVFISIDYSPDGKLQSIMEVEVEDIIPKIFSFRYLNEQEISWDKTHLDKVVLSGKIIVEMEGEQLVRISNYEEDKLVEMVEYVYQGGGKVKEVIRFYTGSTSKIINTYQDDKLTSIERYTGKRDQLEITLRYNHDGNTVNIHLYDSTGTRIADNDMRRVIQNNDRGAWIKLERQFRLPDGRWYVTNRKIQYADDDEMVFPELFEPGNWYSILFKPNLLFFEFNDNGTYDFGFQSVIMDHGTYLINGKQLLLQSNMHQRKGTFELSLQNHLLSLIPIDDPDQFFYPFMMQLDGDEDPNGKMAPDEYKDFLGMYVRLIYGG